MALARWSSHDPLIDHGSWLNPERRWRGLRRPSPYRARESSLHTLWEMSSWLDAYLKAKPVTADK